MTNLFAELPAPPFSEEIKTLLQAPHVRVERIVSQGHASPEGFWYDQEQCEWVALLCGSARIRFEDGVVEMNPGDFLHIAAHRRHRVDWTASDEPTVWLAIFYDLP